MKCERISSPSLNSVFTFYDKHAPFRFGYQTQNKSFESSNKQKNQIKKNMRVRMRLQHQDNLYIPLDIHILHIECYSPFSVRQRYLVLGK